MHGFSRDSDRGLVEKAAYAYAKMRLEREGHRIADVTDRHMRGYDFQCQGHCGKVFEVKGMAEPRDVKFEESECLAAQQRKENYILVCVYNLPSRPGKVGCRMIPNPRRIWQPVGQAKIPKDKWLSV